MFAYNALSVHMLLVISKALTYMCVNSSMQWTQSSFSIFDMVSFLPICTGHRSTDPKGRGTNFHSKILGSFIDHDDHMDHAY